MEFTYFSIDAKNIFFATFEFVVPYVMEYNKTGRTHQRIRPMSTCLTQYERAPKLAACLRHCFESGDRSRDADAVWLYLSLDCNLMPMSPH